MNTGILKQALSPAWLWLGAHCLAGCAYDPQVSVDSELILSPAVRAMTITELRNAEGSCLFDELFYQDTPLHLLLKTASGSPIGDAEVSVYTDFAGNTFAGLSALALYADNNGNGLVDAPDELVSGMDDGIYRAKTGRETGSIQLLLRVNLSCAFHGRVYAFSGPVSGVMEINLTATGEAP